ncbi:MAG: hypothetical protein WCA28_06060 [Bradyrhizobium sp.]
MATSDDLRKCNRTGHLFQEVRHHRRALRTTVFMVNVNTMPGRDVKGGIAAAGAAGLTISGHLWLLKGRENA